MKLWEDARVVRGMQAQLELRRRRLDGGDEPLGWKVGFGAPAMLERLGISGPLVGPPIMRASLRVMARPSPVPPKRCAVVLSAWLNSSNSLACCSGVMPMPVSQTESSTQ